jgi:hypothetical protein
MLVIGDFGLLILDCSENNRQVTDTGARLVLSGINRQEATEGNSVDQIDPTSGFIPSAPWRLGGIPVIRSSVCCFDRNTGRV